MFAQRQAVHRLTEATRLSHQASESFDFHLALLYLDASAWPYDHSGAEQMGLCCIVQANNRSTIRVSWASQLQFNSY